MKFYIAGDWRLKHVIAEISETLSKGIGAQPTFKWWDQQGSAMPSRDSRIALSVRELMAIKSADMFFFVGPGRRGSASELGIALGSGLKVFAWQPMANEYVRESDTIDAANLFLHHPAVTQTTGGLAADALVAAYLKWLADTQPSELLDETYQTHQRLEDLHFPSGNPLRVGLQSSLDAIRRPTRPPTLS